MFSTELAYVLEAAYREAAHRRHAYFCVEHLLFALLFDQDIDRIIKACGGDVEALKIALEDFFEKQIEKLPDAGADQLEIPEPAQTPAVQRVLQKAILQGHSAGKNEISVRELLVALYSEDESHAVHFLQDQGITRLDVVSFISHGVSKVPFDEEDPTELADDGDEVEEYDDEGMPVDRRSRSRSAVKDFLEDLTAKAEAGELDPIIGRKPEIERALKILARRQKNNPLFLGEPGVGKTAMASAIAQRIVGGDVPDSLSAARLFSLNVGTLIAGTRFRGDFEDRVKRIVKELQLIDNPILFIDEIHTIVGAGATGTGSMDVANLLKPVLSSGKIRCIGSTTREDYKKAFEKDRALSRRFSVIELEEPSIEETVRILEGLKSYYEEHHQVRFTHPALRAAADLSAKYINDRFLPDKAIDVLDEAGAANMLLPQNKRRKALSEREIEQVVSLIAKVPVRNVSRSDEELLHNLSDNLRARVFGQNPAIDSISRAIKRSRANLNIEDRPVGSFLFAGPTGVGKTELAKALADEMGVHFHRFDMSEYMEKHAVARLIGAPPGYVGYEEGGQLTDLVRQHPYAVVLFDEIEKAHEDIFNILLQVMDDAILTDSQGKRADFRNVIVIMTTNAGSEKSGGIGFGSGAKTHHREAAIKKLFRPEFRNRLDETVYFNHLPPEVIELIVDKLMSELERQLKERKITFTLSEKARHWLAERGFDPDLGARPMARLIQEKVKDPLTDEILFGRLRKGGQVKIVLKDDALDFEIEGKAESLLKSAAEKVDA